MLLRKIASSKRWNSTHISSLITRKDALFTGDAISDLRTQQNTISVWQTPDLNTNSIKDVIAVMALNCDKIDKIFYVALDEKELERRGLIINNTRGCCPPITDTNILDRHRDISEVDYWHLGLLAEYIYELVKEGKVYSATAADVKSYIADVITNNKLDINQVDDKKRVPLGYAPLSSCFTCQNNPSFINNMKALKTAGII